MVAALFDIDGTLIARNSAPLYMRHLRRTGQARRRDMARTLYYLARYKLGLLDIDRAIRMSGSMFVMYRGGGARLLRALVQLALDRASDAWEEIRPPSLVRTDTMIGTGHLPKFAEDAYQVERA